MPCGFAPLHTYSEFHVVVHVAPWSFERSAICFTLPGSMTYHVQRDSVLFVSAVSNTILPSVNDPAIAGNAPALPELSM